MSSSSSPDESPGTGGSVVHVQTDAAAGSGGAGADGAPVAMDGEEAEDLGSTSSSADLAPGTGPEGGEFVPSTWDFGTVVVGKASPPQTFTLTNTGSQASPKLTTKLMGPNFVIDQDSCNGAMVGPGLQCSVTIRFKPMTIGELNGSLLLTAPMQPSVLATFGGTALAP
jgi:hypothetical protein